ncbi:glycosyltransferase family 4 protein, partial [Mesotoga sp. B105.6.4]|uniref:glycosyltransferase family 4 protein n=1 Tax=Mesotoga sp. B105.6.4 TaxID=1582224 RepID=UPI000CCE0F9E
MIYIINQFYGQRREHLKRELAEYLFSCGFEVTVLTGKNGEKGLKKKEISYINILRISNSSFDGGIVKKLISYITFVIGAFFRILFFEKGSIIVVSSQPFLVARCVTLLKKMKRFRVLYNIQDLFPDIMYSKNISKGTIVYRLMKRVQKKTIDNSDVVITISKSMADLVMTRYSVNASKLRIIENWGNTKIEEEIKRRKKPRNAKGKRLRLIYAGNLGISHEIDTIFECLELISNSNIKHDVEFRIIGFGYNYNILKSKCESRCFGFVHFYDPLSDDELANVFAESDLALIISTKTARGSMVPSKF